MNWPVYDAKARFSELLERTLTEGPQVVTKRGVEAAVLVPMDEWKRLSERGKPGDDPLLDPHGPHDLEIPDRRGFLLRPIEIAD